MQYLYDCRFAFDQCMGGDDKINGWVRLDHQVAE